MAGTIVRNDLFDRTRGLQRGRPFVIETVWHLTKCLLFLTPLPVPSRLKCLLLRLFGARVGRGVVIKPQVKILFPWKLTIGDFAWIGEEVIILNFEPARLGAHCCISQRAFLCGGGHDYRQPDMPYRNGPIVVEDGAWVGAQVFVAPGVTIGTEAVITAGSVVTRDQPPRMVCSGHPCLPLRQRWLCAAEIANSGESNTSWMHPRPYELPPPLISQPSAADARSS
jgi:putative colanic acid biosynthesis acetyltransferase WcaF